MGRHLRVHFETAISNKEYDINNIEAARDYINSVLEFVEFSHKLYMQIENANEMDED